MTAWNITGALIFGFLSVTGWGDFFAHNQYRSHRNKEAVTAAMLLLLVFTAATIYNVSCLLGAKP